MYVCVYGKGLNRSSGDGTERREGEGREGSGEVRIQSTKHDTIHMYSTVRGQVKKNSRGVGWVHASSRMGPRKTRVVFLVCASNTRGT